MLLFKACLRDFHCDNRCEMTLKLYFVGAFSFDVTEGFCSAGLLDIESLPRGVMCAPHSDEGSYSHIAHTSLGIRGCTCWMCTHVARHATPALPVRYLLPRGVVLRCTANNHRAKGQDLFQFILYGRPKGHQDNLTNTRLSNAVSLHNANWCRYNHMCTASSAASVNYFDRPHYSFIQDEKQTVKTRSSCSAIHLHLWTCVQYLDLLHTPL